MDVRKEVTLTLVFKSRRVSSTVLDRLFRTKAVSVEILRGRLSARTSWFELRLEGEAPAVERTIECFNTWCMPIPSLAVRGA